MKKKTILSTILAFCFIVPALLISTACGNTPKAWEETTNTAWYNDTDTEFTLDTEEEFAGFAKLVNDGNDFLGKTIKLSKDLDLDNRNWTPIGNFSADHVVGHAPEIAFRGTFDGQNKTISNIKATKYAIDETSGTYFSCGLFGVISYDATVKNLIISNSSFEGNHYVGALVGYIRSATVENVEIKNSSINCVYANDDASGDKAGALAGYADASSTIKDCTVKNSTVKADRDAGQLIGCTQGKNVTINNCSQTDVTVSCNNSSSHVDGYTKSGQNIKNELVGRKA